jgi:threonine/homoserine efflux transporter RhtA
MNIMNLAIEPVLAVVVGILILLIPRFLNYFVAVYLIVVGVLGLMHHGFT